MGLDYYLINQDEKEYIDLDKDGHMPSDVVVDVLNMLSSGNTDRYFIVFEDDFYELDETHKLQEFKADEYRDFKLVEIKDISEELEQITIVRNKLRQYYRTPDWYNKEI